MILRSAFGLILVCLAVGSAVAQTTAFSYQGRLSEAGAPVAGNRLFRFTLFDEKGAAIPGASVEQTLIVTNGIFTTSLDFGAANFAGANRTLEIAVKVNAGDPYTVLTPRQQILATPFSIKSIAASSADAVSPACVLCISDAQINTVDGSKVTGTIPVATVPTGSGNYIQNASSPLHRGGVQQASFNVDGDGSIGGTINGNVVNAIVQYSLGNSRVLGSPGMNNLFVGLNAATTGPTGTDNTYVGSFAGNESTTGDANSFFGVSAGYNNRGTANSFFGRSAGFQNTTGDSNSFFGVQAGRDNATGDFNSFFGRSAGQSNSTGRFNSFFGSSAGQSNSTGLFNSFFGESAGFWNTVGHANSFFGSLAGASNCQVGCLPGDGQGSDNAFFGFGAGADNIQGRANSFFGSQVGLRNTSGSFNSFFGQEAGLNNTDGSSNAFFGAAAGEANQTGVLNSFFGFDSGKNNTTGGSNSFFGNLSGASNTTGNLNTVLGAFADVTAGGLSSATAIGAGAKVSSSNTIMLGTSFDKVIAAGTMRVSSIPLQPSAAAVCFNAVGDLLQCGASSLRLKTNVHPFFDGLSVLRQLRPISYNWKDGGAFDIGLGAEDVARVAPSLVFSNKKGEAEGVKYERLNLLLINAIKEQQIQIETLRARLRVVENILRKKSGGNRRR